MTADAEEREVSFPPWYHDEETDTGQVRGFFSLELDHACEAPDAYWSCPPVMENIPMSHEAQRIWCWLCGDDLGVEAYSDRIDNDHLGLCDSCIRSLQDDEHATRNAENWNPGKHAALYI